MSRFGRKPLIATLGAVFMGVACGGGGGGGGGSMGPPGAMCVAGSSSTHVTVGDNVFTPTSVSVPVNGSVTWTWAGVNSHNVTFVNGPIPLPTASCSQTSGTHTVMFTQAGTYNYTCTNHSNMDGSVTVTP